METGDSTTERDGWIARRRQRRLEREQADRRAREAAERARRETEHAEKLERLSGFYPDAEFRWEPTERAEILRFVWDRDGRRCGICGGPTRLEGAHLEHIVPKHLVYFDVAEDRAVPGLSYASAYHQPHNLQAAHPACNQWKGATNDVDLWRHPTMPAVAVASTYHDQYLLLPRTPAEPHPRYLVPGAQPAVPPAFGPSVNE